MKAATSSLRKENFCPNLMFLIAQAVSKKQSVLSISTINVHNQHINLKENLFPSQKVTEISPDV